MGGWGGGGGRGGVDDMGGLTNFAAFPLPTDRGHRGQWQRCTFYIISSLLLLSTTKPPFVQKSVGNEESELYKTEDNCDEKQMSYLILSSNDKRICLISIVVAYLGSHFILCKFYFVIELRNNVCN